VIDQMQLVVPQVLDGGGIGSTSEKPGELAYGTQICDVVIGGNGLAGPLLQVNNSVVTAIRIGWAIRDEWR
jgi:hypothetical protein